VLDTFLKELNGVALSPVALFDAARIHPDPTGIHFTYGGGVRVTFFNISLTGAYAVNPHPVRSLGQGRGAVVFSFEVSDIFR
jgi:hypothetical protein